MPELESEAPIIVAGMHRSGTSLTASLISAIGVDMGVPLPADRFNPAGYFEDVEILEFQRRLLAECCTSEDGWPDWGWTRTGHLDTERIGQGREAAARLVSERRASGRVWGWKDPRTTLLLDLWKPIFPKARFVFVYRSPWEVSRSVARTGHPAQLRESDFALRVWCAYNRAILQFLEEFDGRCVLVALDAVVRQPDRFEALVRASLGLHAPTRSLDVAVKKHFRPDMLRRLAGDDPSVRECLWLVPEAADVQEGLEHLADLGDPESLNALNAHRRASVSPAIPAVDQKGVTVRSRKSQVTLSVVIPCYNQGEFLMEAVASVEALVDDRVEVVIVDDGSDDQASPPVFRYLEEQGYEVIHQPNAGLAAARNAGITASRGRYLLPLDADNCILPQYISRAIELLEEDDQIGVVYGDAVYFGDREGRWTVGEFSLDRLVRGNFIDACAVFRREVWRSSGGYDPKMPAQGWEDWDFWLGAAERGWGFRYVPEVLFRYRVRGDSMLAETNRPDNTRRLLRYIASKHARLYAVRFPEIWGEVVSQLAAERAEFRQQLSTRDEEIRSLGNEAAQLAALRAELAAREEDVRSARASMAELQNKPASEQIRLAEAEKESGRLAREAAAAKERVRQFEEDLAASWLERDRLAGEMDEHTRAVQTLMGENRSLRDQGTALTAQLAGERAEVERLRSSLADQESRARAQIAGLEAQIGALLSSSSWRLTAPARILKSGLRALADGLRHPWRRLRRLRQGLRDRRLLRKAAAASLFDEGFYQETYPDVAAAGVDPLLHYQRYGAREGRNPHPLFNTSYYLEQNPDVAASGMNALAHYFAAGGREGRNPHPLFDTASYLTAHPEVAATGLNPLAHYLGGRRLQS